MLRSLLPPGTVEFLLFVVMVGAFVLVVRSVRNRRKFASAAYNAGGDAENAVPILSTPVRVRGTVRRVFPDRQQDALVVEVQIGKKRLVFRPADSENIARYETLAGGKETADFTLYALATLAAGGVEAMREQIKDWDSVNARADMVGLFPAGEFSNDYAVIAKIKNRREDTVDNEPVWVYSAQVVKTGDQELFLELACDAAPPMEPLKNNTMAHGSARLFGAFAAD